MPAASSARCIFCTVDTLESAPRYSKPFTVTEATRDSTARSSLVHPSTARAARNCAGVSISAWVCQTIPENNLCILYCLLTIFLRYHNVLYGSHVPLSSERLYCV